MSSFINTYGGELSTGRSGLGAVQRALAAGLTINQIDQIGRQQGISFGSAARDYIQKLLIQQAVQPFQQQASAYQTQLETLQGQASGFQEQLDKQASQFQEAQEMKDKELKKAQAQAAEFQAQQFSQGESAQLSLGGKSVIVRPSARSRFNRKGLQIKSMNI